MPAKASEIPPTIFSTRLTENAQETAVHCVRRTGHSRQSHLLHRHSSVAGPLCWQCHTGKWDTGRQWDGRWDAQNQPGLCHAVAVVSLQLAVWRGLAAHVAVPATLPGRRWQVTAQEGRHRYRSRQRGVVSNVQLFNVCVEDSPLPASHSLQLYHPNTVYHQVRYSARRLCDILAL